MDPATTTVAEPPAGVAKPGSPAAQNKVPLQPLDYAFQTLLLPLKKSLARIEEKLAGNGAGPLMEAAAGPSADEDSLGVLLQRLELLSAEVADFRREAVGLLKTAPAPQPIAAEAVESLLPVEPDLLDLQPHDSWEEILFGSELTSNPALAGVRQKFLSDVVSGVIPARALAGQLLLLQTTPVEEMPERFRHVGEAYYRWRPRSTTAADPLEQALADWLTRRADAAGLRNTIQLVRPGDRFDSNRHAAATRGVEIVAVHGWVVLRDNQKVYTKASVTVQ